MAFTDWEVARDRLVEQREFMLTWPPSGRPASGLWRHVHPPMLPESRP